MKGFFGALGFLTRIPLPLTTRVALSESAPWFPAAGIVVGLIVYLADYCGSLVSPWMAAFLALFFWVVITGAIHIDGLADLSDALGACHKDKERFIAVLHDPHKGTFGIVAIQMLLIGKLVFLVHLDVVPELILIPAWARFGALLWAIFLPALTEGLGKSFSGFSRGSLLISGALLVTASLFVAPVLLFAVVPLYFWYRFLKKRVGGMNGDCLGAGIEITEASILFACVLQSQLAG